MFFLYRNPQPDLNGSRCKIGREWKAEIAAQNIKCKKPENDSGFICFDNISILINQFSLVFLYPL